MKNIHPVSKLKEIFITGEKNVNEFDFIHQRKSEPVRESLQHCPSILAFLKNFIRKWSRPHCSLLSASRCGFIPQHWEMPDRIPMLQRFSGIGIIKFYGTIRKNNRELIPGDHFPPRSFLLFASFSFFCVLFNRVGWNIGNFFNPNGYTVF